MQSYEVEIKALLGSGERAEELRQALKKADADCTLVSRNNQLNHYFEPAGFGDGDAQAALQKLADAATPHLSDEARAKFADLAAKARSFSVRTRDKENIVLLVVKASVDDTTSENGISRMEFEASVPLGLVELDTLILDSGFTYQAKWSREREEYLCNGMTVCIDKNAGYGYVAEFERVVHDPSELESARDELRAMMRTMGVEELAQDRLERMFAFYNAHWPEYYGTDRIFVVE